MAESAELPLSDTLVLRLCGAINLAAQAADDARVHGLPAIIAINRALQGLSTALLATTSDKPTGRPCLQLLEGGRP
jgi:hypothetical protein